MTARAPRTARLSREVREAQILAAATEEFRLAGFDGASMSSIAARAGMVEGSIYRFFDGKAALLTRTIETWYEGMLHSYAQELAGIEGTRPRLRFMVWRHLQTVFEEPELCRLMFNHVRGSAGYRDTQVYRLNSLYTARTLEIIRDGIAAGEIRAGDDLRLVRDLIYGGVEHAIWGYLWGGGTLDPDALADAMVEIVMGGIAAPDPVAARLSALAESLERH
ncbi:TetR/AcrR family transcriptional regulator [Sulfitobacter alexandrii]|uniref:TetR/AcrR family transcriptional regulator n=1 Tax=Sulfitobacter alexandrii TaxID=1917485 RepID=UPI0009FA633E|nr:TetR family transcriptional regulator [Sulfitobacter alexandrii]